MAVNTKLERSADDVSPATRRHHFVAGGEKRRAHGRRIFATTATTVALLEIVNERPVLKSECEHWFKRQFHRLLEIIAQVIVDFVPAIAQNLTRIKNIFWV